MVNALWLTTCPDDTTTLLEDEDDVSCTYEGDQPPIFSSSDSEGHGEKMFTEYVDSQTIGRNTDSEEERGESPSTKGKKSEPLRSQTAGHSTVRVASTQTLGPSQRQTRSQTLGQSPADPQEFHGPQDSRTPPRQYQKPAVEDDEGSPQLPPPPMNLRSALRGILRPAQAGKPGFVLRPSQPIGKARLKLEKQRKRDEAVDAMF